MTPAAPPARVTDLDTPAILIDLDIMERNLQRLAEYARGHGLRLRPHTKTHKIPALARKQLDLGAAGLTVAKVSEAEVMLAAEPADLLIAYPLVGRRKLERLMEVAAQTNVTVAVDSLEVARQMSEAAVRAGMEIGILAEFDAGLGRVGVAPAQIVALAKGAARLPGLRWDGVAFYPGHIKRMDEPGFEALARLGALLESVLRDLREAGLRPRVVSGGSTPTLFHSHLLPGLTEIRPGTYIFNDRNTALAGACAPSDCAASILATIVSTSIPGQIIIDGGSKTFSSDGAAGAAEPSFGHVLEAPAAVFRKMNEEHGFIDIRETGQTFAVGGRVRIVPNHICVAMNLHECVYGIRDGAVERAWRVEGRGKLQ